MELVWGAIWTVEQQSALSTVKDDAALMCRYRQGDEQAFEQLYRRYRGPLYRFIVRLMLNRADADEVFQEVWVAVVKGRERYEPTARFATLLFAIAHRRIADHGRRAGRRREAEIPPDVEDAAAGPSVLAENAALGEALLVAIAMLPQTQREVFLLKAEGELTLEEIADITVAPYETVKSRLKYANRALREKLGSWR